MRCASTALVLLAATACASATPVLDQAYEAPFDMGSGVSNSDARAQSFTVGVDGILSSIEIPIYRDSGSRANGLALEILAAPGGVPSRDPSDLLYSTGISLFGVPISSGMPAVTPWLAVDVSAASIAVAVGDTLAIGLRRTVNGTSVPRVFWLGTARNATYAEGGYYTRRATYEPFGDGTADVGFRVFVDVPEPGLLALVATGLLLFRRRRRRPTGA